MNRKALRAAKTLTRLLPIDAAELLDVVVVLIEERGDLSAAEDELVAYIDQLTPFEGAAETVADLVTPMLVRAVLKHVATPEARQEWLAKRQEQVAELRERLQARKDAR